MMDRLLPRNERQLLKYVSCKLGERERGQLSSPPNTPNLRPGGGLSHPRQGGWGWGWSIRPSSNLKTRRTREADKKWLNAQKESSRNYFGHFFAQVKIVASRGVRIAQTIRFLRKANIGYFRYNVTFNISGTIIARESLKHIQWPMQLFIEKLLSKLILGRYLIRHHLGYLGTRHRLEGGGGRNTPAISRNEGRREMGRAAF